MLRENKAEMTAFTKVAKTNAIFVYSSIHVEVCRASGRPEEFVQVMEDLPAYFLEPASAAYTQLAPSPGRARDLILAKPEIEDLSQRRMEDILKVFHFASGGLDENVQELKDEMISGNEEFWTTLQQSDDLTILDEKTRGEVLYNCLVASEGMKGLIQNLPFQQFSAELKEGFSHLKANLPTNFAQLDEMPAEEVTPYIISCFDKKTKEEFQEQYPQGFWSDIEDRKYGDLAGFSFALFMVGLVRDRRIKKGEKSKREKHFPGQFRDCMHIEHAARCAVFITKDKGAARLAKAVYAYAGVQTQVALCERQKKLGTGLFHRVLLA